MKIFDLGGFTGIAFPLLEKALAEVIAQGEKIGLTPRVSYEFGVEDPLAYKLTLSAGPASTSGQYSLAMEFDGDTAKFFFGQHYVELRKRFVEFMGAQEGWTVVHDSLGHLMVLVIVSKV